MVCCHARPPTFSFFPYHKFLHHQQTTCFQEVMLVAPTTHFVIFAQAILFRGADLDVVWPQFIGLVVMGGAFFGIALARFRKTIGTMA